MGQETADLDEQIERLRKGDTLLESEVRALCEKVRPQRPKTAIGIHCVRLDPAVISQADSDQLWSHL
jgi:hypothetical protein